ncbi:sensor histidine kinase [Paenactinomyces guangxiensis]|uniref:histidine kinase n=1 Tax=Paenactinomyces guangxiensis TaxID=1490290 RepID=A0A7W1WNW1_9BACL|nr:sensor histidine kinase [Paenactinomyces guangxiensis]MBA4493344.1 sensor histidine kinase [Paenactinomyces guangxiensis]MBH8593430.1 sensor histidine kinase [Paenactinomyces guangxiensis]
MKALIKKVVARYFLASFKSTILSLFLPIIIVFIMMTGMVSYLLAASQLEENTYKSVNDTVFQTKSYLENRLSDIFEELVVLSNHPDTLSLIAKDPNRISPEDYIKMDHLMDTISSNNPIIESVLIHLHDGKFVLSNHQDFRAKISFSYGEYRDKYNGSPQDYYWRNLHPDDVFHSSGEKNEVVSVFKLIGRKGSKANGILLFNLRRDFFNEVLDDSLLGENGYFVLVNEDGLMAFKTVDREYWMNDEVLKYMQEIKTEKGQFDFEKPSGKKIIVIYDTLGVNKWKIAAVFPEEDILEKVNYIKFVTLLVIIVLMIVAIFLASLIAKFITRPISYLVSNMKKIHGGFLDLKLDIHGASEVGILYKGIRDLVVRVNRLLDQIRKEQETKRQLELAVMQAQMNPHFLYNTLYSIKGLCDMQLHKDASAMVTALSNFFRISISKGQEIITVQEEIDHISNYLFIQEMRYGDDFSYEIDVEPHILKCRMIKLTLQPLVENAIYHGVKQKRGAGRIQVKGYQTGNDLCFEVRDNGAGMAEEKLEEIRGGLITNDPRKLGFGVRSVHERIQIHFGKSYGLRIDSKKGEGTVARIIIPLAEG